MNNRLIYLTGFMASGKSTIGPILANTIGWEFYDLDRLIEVKCSKPITKIFSEDGEDYFRKIEKETLNEVTVLDQYVISLGGGTIADKENLAIIKASGILVYLESSPEEAYKRLRFKRDRPALLFNSENEPSKEEFIKRINSLLEKRMEFYEQADYKISTDNVKVGRTVDKIALIIRKEFSVEKNSG